jgi:hypothetical protein
MIRDLRSVVGRGRLTLLPKSSQPQLKMIHSFDSFIRVSCQLMRAWMRASLHFLVANFTNYVYVSQLVLITQAIKTEQQLHHTSGLPIRTKKPPKPPHSPAATKQEIFEYSSSN